jgi:hypothetical protein
VGFTLKSPLAAEKDRMMAPLALALTLTRTLALNADAGAERGRWR